MSKKYLIDIDVSGNITTTTGDIIITTLPSAGTFATSDFIVRNTTSGALEKISISGTASASTYLRGDGTWSTISGGDADTLDTLDSTQFLRSDVADTKTAGNLTFLDNVSTVLGTGGDMLMYHTGTNNRFQLNSGDLEIYDGGATSRFTFGRTTGDLTATGNIYLNVNSKYFESYSPTYSNFDGSTSIGVRLGQNSGTGELSFRRWAGTTTIHQNALIKQINDGGWGLAFYNSEEATNVDASILTMYLTKDNDVEIPNGNITADALITAGGTSSQFVKGDGSLDSSTYLTTTGNGSGLTNVNATTLDSIDSTQFLRSDVFDIKSAGNLRFNDSVGLTFGNSDDSQIYFDTTNLRWNLIAGDIDIRDNGTTRFTLERTTGDFINTGNIETAGYVDTSQLRLFSGGLRSDFEEGSLYKYYLTATGTDTTNWKEICTINIGTLGYKGLAMRVILDSLNSNFGSQASNDRSDYSIAIYRSGAVQDDVDTVYVYGEDPPNHEIRVIRTSAGVWELQIKQKATYKDAIVTIEVLNTNVGTITMKDGIVNGSTTGTAYTASRNINVEHYVNALNANKLLVEGGSGGLTLARFERTEGATGSFLDLNCNSNEAQIQFQTTTTNDFTIGVDVGNNFIIADGETLGTGTERIVIDSTGRIGVNKASSINRQLHVYENSTSTDKGVLIENANTSGYASLSQKVGSSQITQGLKNGKGLFWSSGSEASDSTWLMTLSESGNLSVDSIITGEDALRKTVDDKTTSYTLITTDRSKIIRVTGSNNVNITVNTGSLSNIGETIEVDHWGTGTCTIVAGTATLRINSNVTAVLDGQYSRAAIQKITSTEYRVFGELTPV